MRFHRPPTTLPVMEVAFDVLLPLVSWPDMTELCPRASRRVQGLGYAAARARRRGRRWPSSQIEREVAAREGRRRRPRHGGGRRRLAEQRRGHVWRVVR